MKQRCKICLSQFIHKNPNIGFCSSTCYKKSLIDLNRKMKKSIWVEFWRVDTMKNRGYLLTPEENSTWQMYNAVHQNQLFKNNKA